MDRHIKGTPLFLALTLAACSSGSGWKPAPASPVPISTGDPPARPPSLDGEIRGAAKPATPAGTAPPAASPIPGDLPADLDAPLGASATCKEKECSVPGLYPPSPAIDGKAPAAVWSHELAGKGNAVLFPRHVGVDLYGVVLRGAVELTGTGADEKPVVAKTWSAFHAPGAGLRVTATGAGARVVLAAVTGGEPVAEAVVKLRGKDGGKVDWKKRPSAIELRDLAATGDLAWAGGAMHARIGFEGEHQRASLGILMASKDAAVAQHQHDGSWEILVALRAEGTLKRAAVVGSSDVSPVPVTDGAVIAIPKGTQHAWVPGGVRPLVAVQLYVPAGPEQRFKKLASEASGGLGGRSP